MISFFRLIHISLAVILFTTKSFASDNNLILEADSPEIIHLTGVWLLESPGYKQEVITIEDGPVNNSKRSYGTYHKNILLESDSSLDLSIYIPLIRTSFELKVNNVLVAEQGKVSQNRKFYHPGMKVKPYDITLHPGKNTISITFANYAHAKGGLITPPVIGTHDDVLWHIRKSDIILTAIYGSIILLGIFFILFFISWKKDMEILYFGLFAIMWAVRCISTASKHISFLYNNFEWETLIRIDYFGFYCSILFGFLFFNKLFKSYSIPDFSKLVVAGTSLMVISTIVTPVKVFTEATVFVHFILSPVIIYVIYLSYQSYKNNDDISKIGLAAAISAMAIFGLEWLLFFQTFSIPDFSIDLGYLLIFLLNASTLSRRFAKRFNQLETLQRETTLQNIKIEEQHNKIQESHNTILNQRDELEKKHKEITAINKSLEEKVFERTKELEKANNELDTFLYRASHDLRRPLTSIQGLCSIALGNLSSEELHQLLKMMRETAGTMDNMLKKLISISEIYHYDDQKDIVNLNNLRIEILSEFKSKLSLSGVKLEFVHDTEDIHINKRLIFLILFHLIDNSIQYRKKDINNSESKIEIKIKQECKNVVISVYDNGMGIEKSQLDNVCKMFYKATDRSTGNGLGLYLCKAAINKLGGEMSILSREHSYTEVIFNIPAEPVNIKYQLN
ncbi:sensor histidine kinase [Mangrovivirga sp. M17]|uniref:histidine kinase n=1 Tax=Mangrovivirga halotolerans TaxID=2993936 RepID=A0ABT3RWR5_9BACT|nr:sensor histidine kinase [Mangrovivirga halotolerans]MCX2746116.1 sensor histidine kinase [Mangrovivirga halotolerans]